jgi:hypothetical protein
MRLLRGLKPLMRTSFLAFVCAGLLLVLASVVGNAIVHYGMVYPTPETQSSFLKSYLPTEVIEAFDAHQGSSRGDGMGSEAGRGFASHKKTVDFYFVTRPENTSRIVKALCDDAVLALQGNKMRVADRAVTTGGGYRINYAGGKTEGTVTIEPIVAYDRLLRDMPLPSGELDVKAEIRIEEKWRK